jgi:hypothetical protein
MSETKYGKHLIHEPFYKSSEESGSVTIFGNKDDKDSGVIFEHYYVTNPKWSIDEIRTSDTHELYCFVGGNPENIRDLGAEITMSLGESNEEQIINDTTVVTIPSGLKHGSVSVKKFSKPFVFLRIYNTRKYQDDLNSGFGNDDTFNLDRLIEGNEVAKHGKKYWMNTIRGPLFVDYEPGWTGTSIWAHHNEYRSGTSLGYHCIVTPYDVRFSHAHDFHENLCFLSGDPENPGELGADVKVCFGNELEEHTFNTPTIMSMPPGLKHCPLLVHNIKKPVIFLEVSATKLFIGKPEDV